MRTTGRPTGEGPMTDQDTDSTERRIAIPERTAKALERRLEGTEFETVDEYATFALEQLLRELRRNQGETEDTEAASETVSEGVADEDVEGRLESLGYL